MIYQLEMIYAEKIMPAITNEPTDQIPYKHSRKVAVFVGDHVYSAVLIISEGCLKWMDVSSRFEVTGVQWWAEIPRVSTKTEQRPPPGQTVLRGG